LFVSDTRNSAPETRYWQSPEECDIVLFRFGNCAMWRFVHLSDPHLASQRDGEWNNRFLCSMMPEVMACLRKDLAPLRPDFILVTGDVCSRQTHPAMLEARDQMESLGFPYYPMGGNHDFVLEDSRDWFIDAFADCLPEPSTFYSFTHKNLHFCVMDAWWKWSDGTLSPISEASVAADLDATLDKARWAIPPNQLDWLETDLSLHDALPTIVAVHCPAVPIPARMRRPGVKDSGALDNANVLLDLLGDYPQVKAIFSGHMHMHYIENTCGLVHVVTGALPEYPTEYRDVQVFEDRLEVHTCGLSDPQFAARSLIPGKEWTRGEERDRSVIIPL